MDPRKDEFDRPNEPEAKAPEGEAAASADALFVLQRLQAGAQPGAIVDELAGRGMGRGQASYLVESLQVELARQLERAQLTPSHLALAAVGALAAAVLGGVAWAALTVATDSEFGYGALGIGLLSGFGVVLATGMRKGRPLQILAVLSAALGILIGKYGTVYWLIRQSVEAQQGAEAAQEISPFSPDLFSAFFGSASDWASPYDLLWIGLAVMVAWGIPRAKGLAVPAKPG